MNDTSAVATCIFLHKCCATTLPKQCLQLFEKQIKMRTVSSFPRWSLTFGHGYIRIFELNLRSFYVGMKKSPSSLILICICVICGWGCWGNCVLLQYMYINTNHQICNKNKTTPTQISCAISMSFTQRAYQAPTAVAY